jgi:hypothetical protein
LRGDPGQGRKVLLRCLIEIAAHGASRGSLAEDEQAPEGRKSRYDRVSVGTILILTHTLKRRIILSN